MNLYKYLKWILNQETGGLFSHPRNPETPSENRRVSNPSRTFKRGLATLCFYLHFTCVISLYEYITKNVALRNFHNKCHTNN